MEQQRKGLAVAAAAKRELAAARALELEAKHPQLSVYENEVEHISPVAVGGGAAGIARVVGAGKKKRAAKVTKAMKKAEMESESEGEEMEGKEMAGGAHKQGKMLAEHLEKLHGAGWLTDFAKGLMSGVKTLGSVVSNIPGPVGMIGSLAKGAIEHGERMGEEAAQQMPRGRGRPKKVAMMGMMKGGDNQIAHAPMSHIGQPGSGTGGQDVPPGGMAPFAYGNVPQAPASFQRNTVGMGASGGAKKVSKGGKRAPSARNVAIGKLIREKGMTLAQASAHYKAHGGEA